MVGWATTKVNIDTTDACEMLEYASAERESGREKYASVDLRNLRVYLHGDVATVSGEYSQTGTKDGKDISSKGLYVDTWVKRNGNWKVVSSVFP